MLTMNIRKLFQCFRKKRSEESTSTSHGNRAVSPDVLTQPLLPIDRLDIQRAMILHLEWCVVFNDRLGADSSLPPLQEALPTAHDSELGQWLAQARHRAPGRHPLFAELEQEHLRVHQLAEKALALTRDGHLDRASTLLNTDFERSRTRVLDILRSLQQG